MKHLSLPTLALALFSAVFLSSCDWSSGSNKSFSGSRTDGSNISGFYEGELSGDLAVSNRQWNIRNLTIQQSGNTLRISDNNGSNYDGTVGELLSSSENSPFESGITENGGTTDGGSAFSTFQVSFSGLNRKSGEEMRFAGTVVVATESEIVGGTFDQGTGEILDTISEVQMTMTLKGNWIEANGISYNVQAKVVPFTVEEIAAPGEDGDGDEDATP